MDRSRKSGLTLLAIVALIAAAGGLSMVLQLEAIAVLCPLVVVVTPVGLFAWWILFQRGSTGGDDGYRWVRRGLVIVSLLGLMVSLLPGLAFGVMWLHILEPWPLSAEQGPDTERAVEGFKRVMGFDPPEDADKIFYKGYEIRDYQRFLKFSSCSQTTRATVLEGLESRPPADPPSFFVDESLDWWFTGSEATTFEHWVRPSGFWEVWVNPDACTFYVVSWTT